MQNLLDRREVRIRRMFDGIAPKYDFLNHLLSLNIDKGWRRRVVKKVKPTTGPILDLCTGTGDLAFEYERRSDRSIAITGADFSEEMLKFAIAKAAARQSRVRFLQADAQHLPFEDNHFEIVSIAFGIRNVTDYQRGLEEMTRVTKPGGRVAILEFSKPRNWFFSAVYKAYCKLFLPVVGQLLSRSDEKAYVYLPASVMEFPDGDVFADKMRAAGLKDITYSHLTFGIATLYIGTK